MGKKKTKHLSEAEIWDDSALLQSWDDALAEYKMYHSIQAKGENVEDAIKALAAATSENGVSTVAGSGQDGAAAEDASDLEDGEVAEDDFDQEAEASVDDGHLVSNGQSQFQATQATTPAQPALPQALSGSVSDEAMRNLMMSWYYAGYYTGLAEGQRTVTKPDSG